MKIGFDAKRLYNNFTGLGNYSRTTIDILMEYVPEHQYYLYSPAVTRNDVTLPYLEAEGCRTIVPTGLTKGSLWRSYGMADDLLRNGIDLFHGLSNEIPIGLAKRGIPTVVTIHDVAFHTFKEMYRWHDRMIYHQKWKYACKHADHIIAISESTRRDIIRFFDVHEEKISVVYQPVNKVYYEDNVKIDEDNVSPYLLYVGSVNSRKNLLGIVKAMELLPADLQIPLTIVGGGGSYKRRVEQYIAEHHMEHLFRWTTAIDSEHLQQLYANATLLLYPSFYEGFGLPVVEALLSGCPVLTSGTSSLPEAGGPYSLQINPLHIEEISNGIVKILTDDSLRHQMIEEGRKYALKKFHPETLAKQLAGVYGKLKN